MLPGIGRREILVRMALAAAALWRSWSCEAQTSRTRLILLGTSGGPRPRKASSDAGAVALGVSGPDEPVVLAVTDEMWIEAARTHFRGSIVVGKDLMEI